MSLLDPNDLSFRSAVSFALGKFRSGRTRLTDAERDGAARIIAAHLKRCGWSIHVPDRPLGPDIMAGPSARVARGLNPGDKDE